MEQISVVYNDVEYTLYLYKQLNYIVKYLIYIEYFLFL